MSRAWSGNNSQPEQSGRRTFRFDSGTWVDEATDASSDWVVAPDHVNVAATDMSPAEQFLSNYYHRQQDAAGSARPTRRLRVDRLIKVAAACIWLALVTVAAWFDVLSPDLGDSAGFKLRLFWYVAVVGMMAPLGALAVVGLLWAAIDEVPTQFRRLYRWFTEPKGT